MSNDQFKILSHQITEIREHTDSLESRISVLEKKVSDLSDQILMLYRHMEERFASFEAVLKTKPDGEQVYRTFDIILEKLERIEAKLEVV